MRKHPLTILAAAALLAATSAANAAVHRVFPGESIQDAIDVAQPGDTILVEPGDYQEDPSSRYGLRIATDNLRLVGKSRPADDGTMERVRIIATGDQETGILAAPPGCEYDMNREECAEAMGGSLTDLQQFYIRGFVVDGFPVNGIQTRWVDGFEFSNNESANNLNNGIYPTLSANGLVRNNVSYGSLDTAMWVAGSENVRVFGNVLRDSVIGFEITVSNDVTVRYNEIYGNTVGIGLFHPNGAGNPPLPEMADWVIQQNTVYANNGSPTPAPPGTFQEGLPAGVGILLLGVSDHNVSKNVVRGNDFVGIGILGWCTAVATGDPSRNCENDPPVTDPAANNNLVAANEVYDNAQAPSTPGLEFLAGDFTYFDFGDGSTGNCFKRNNRPPDDFTFVSSEPDGELPTDGC
ncbi:MAG: right-handed parallel beta-helix repeat-containing protein [Pseudomonadota bacterium]